MNAFQAVADHSLEKRASLEHRVISMASETNAQMLIKDLEQLRQNPIDPEWTFRGIRYALRIDDLGVLSKAVKTLSELARDPDLTDRALATLGSGYILHRGSSRLRNIIQMTDECEFPAAKSTGFVAALLSCFLVKCQYETSSLMQKLVLSAAPEMLVIPALVVLGQRGDLSGRWEDIRAAARKIDIGRFNQFDYVYTKYISEACVIKVNHGATFAAGDQAAHDQTYVRALDIYRSAVADSAIIELLSWMGPSDLRRHIPFLAHILASEAVASTKSIVLRALRGLGSEVEYLVPLFENLALFKDSHELNCLALERIACIDPARQSSIVETLSEMMAQEDEEDFEKPREKICQAKRYVLEALSYIGHSSGLNCMAAYRAKELASQYLLNTTEREDHRLKLLQIIGSDSELAATYIDPLLEIMKRERIYRSEMRRLAKAAAVNAISVLKDPTARVVTETAKICAC